MSEKDKQVRVRDTRGKGGEEEMRRRQAKLQPHSQRKCLETHTLLMEEALYTPEPDIVQEEHVPGNLGQE